MELRAARAAARRRVGAYTAIVTAVGFAWLVLAAPAAARVAGHDPGPVLLLAALVLAAELMPLELGRPGTRDSTTMSQPFAFALMLGWGTPAGVVALGACSALADLPAERREFVDMAVRQGTRLKELIEQLLLAAWFEQAASEPAERPLVDATAVARDALAAARVAHPGRELVLVGREACPSGRLPRPSSRSSATCSTTR